MIITRKVDKDTMIKPLIIVYLLSITESSAFFARWINDPDESCSVDDQSYYQDQVQCVKQDGGYLNSIPFEQLNESLTKGVVNTYQDLSAANSLSHKIINESEKSKEFYKNFQKMKALSDESEEEKTFSNAVNLLANLEYKIDLASRGNCMFMRNRTKVDREKSAACSKKKRERLEPLLFQKATLVSQNPLLSNGNISEMIEDLIDRKKDHFRSKQLSISNCKRKNRRSRKNKPCPDAEALAREKKNAQILVSQSDYSSPLDEALKESINSTNKLIKRHTLTSKRIKRFLKKPKSLLDLKEFRDDLFYDRELTTDFYVAAGPSKEFGKFGNFRCRMTEEYDLNEKNAFINSIALDVAVMAIPMGGPLLMARAAMRIEKLARLGKGALQGTKLASTSRFSTMTAELAALGFDTNNLNNEFAHCEEVLGRSAALRVVPEHLNGTIEECKEQLNNMTMSYVASTLGGAVGLFTLPKRVSKLSKTAKTTKAEDPVLSLPSELKISEAELSDLTKINSSQGFPLLTRRHMEVLALAPEDSKLVVEVSKAFATKEVLELSPSELKAFLKSNELDAIKISEIKHTRTFTEDEGATIAAKISEKDLEYVNYDEATNLTVVVKYKSGEVGSYSGNRDMIKELSLREDIDNVKYSLDPPRSVDSGYKVPKEKRSPNFDSTGELFKSINPDSIVQVDSKNLGDLENLDFYHGTIKAMENSVKGGPKNVGKGFGGPGLYIDISPDAKIAREYSEHARSAAENRISNIDSDAARSISVDDKKPVVIKGQLNVGDQKLTVGRFEIVRGGEPNLEKGILPANWDEDPRLVKMMQEKFDILDLRGMKSNGLNLDTDRILVVHEKAGKDIIKWD